MGVTGSINAGMSKMARSMRNGVDNRKTDGKIVEKQNFCLIQLGTLKGF